MGTPRLYSTPEEKAAAKRRDRAKYQASEKGQRKRAEWEAAHPELVAARYARYRETDKYRAAQARYAASEGGKRTEAQYQQWVKETAPLRVRARAAVATALRAGKLERPVCCDDCGKYGIVPDAHHAMGYMEPHWLDVEWLCRPCHKRWHIEELT